MASGEAVLDGADAGMPASADPAAPAPIPELTLTPGLATSMPTAVVGPNDTTLGEDD